MVNTYAFFFTAYSATAQNILQKMYLFSGILFILILINLKRFVKKRNTNPFSISSWLNMVKSSHIKT